MKREKAFKAKPAYEVSLKIEGRKFFKAGSYSSTPFFSSPALLFEVIKNDRPVRLHPVTAEEIQKAIVLPTRSQPITTARVERPKRNSNQPIVVDLHAANLLDTMVGLTPHDILEYQMKVFRDKMDEHVKQRGKRLIFIHGKGNGILRQTILKELQKHYNSCRVQDASFREFGYGATLVVIA